MVDATLPRKEEETNTILQHGQSSWLWAGSTRTVFTLENVCTFRKCVYFLETVWKRVYIFQQRKCVYRCWKCVHLVPFKGDKWGGEVTNQGYGSYKVEEDRFLAINKLKNCQYHG